VQPTKINKSDTIFKEINIGGFFGSGIDSNGIVWTWGSNDNGELGVGDREPRN